MIDGCERTSTIYVGYSIVRKTDRSLSKGKDVVVCLPGARIEHVTERVKKIMARGKGGSIVVHVGTNNADKEGTTAILDKYRYLLKKTKQARVGQIIISGILPVFGNKIQGYRNSKTMAVNGMVERLCKEEDVKFCILFNLTLESFVRSRWPEQVETLGGFMQPSSSSSSLGSHSVSWLDEGLSIPPSS